MRNRVLSFPAFGVVLCTVALPCTTQAQNLFEEVSVSAGVRYIHVNNPSGPIGGGAAWVDVNNDGFDDLYTTQGIGCNPLYLNNGDGTFSAVPDAAGASDCASVTLGVTAADYDNDGDQDLFTSNNSFNRLFKNMWVETGALAFVDVADAAGIGSEDLNSTHATWGDFDRDGHLDLHISNHILVPFPLTCAPDSLWHAQGDGTFVNIAAQTGIDLSGDINKTGCPLASTFSDYDNDGDPDLFIVNDLAQPMQNEVPNRLFRNDGPDGQGGWIFTDVSDFTGFNWFQSGMGIAVGDFDRNGMLDYYATDIGVNEFAVSNGDGTFTESSETFGVAAADSSIWGWFGLVGWGAGFFDLDLDGWLDLTVCNGGVPQDQFPGLFGGAAYTQINPCYVFRNRLAVSGDFAEVHESLGVTAEGYYRGAAFSDYDNDGDIDMHFSNLTGANALYQNRFADLTTVNWLKVKVVGTLSNRDGIGAKVRAKTVGVTQLHEVDGGSSHLSRNTLTAHFGLAASTTADLSVEFPSGLTQELRYVDSNQLVEVTEPLVSAKLDLYRRVVPEGGLAIANVTITNHSEQSQTRDMWVTQVSSAGETNVNSPTSITLAAGESTVRRVLLTTNAQPGVTVYGARLGDFGVDVKHRNHATVIVPELGE